MTTVTLRQPIVLAVPLDETTGDLVDAARTLAQRLGTALVPVHALSRLPARAAYRDEETARAREALLRWLEPVAGAGVSVTEPVIEAAAVGELVLRVADRTRAQLIIAGHGRGATIQEWLLGSAADELLRHARVPVYLARGTTPGPKAPIVCPVDGSPQSRTGLFAALRLARLFGAPLRVVTVIEAIESRGAIASDALSAKVGEMEATARREAEELLASVDTAGVALELVVEAGEVTTVLIEASRDAHLLVLASRSFDRVVPMSTGNVTERLVRRVRCSVLAVRDATVDHGERDATLRHVAELRTSARKALDVDDPAGAVELLRAAVSLAPAHAGLEDELASALERAGHAEDAAVHRGIAQDIREHLG